jgi:hypothetical protein
MKQVVTPDRGEKTPIEPPRRSAALGIFVVAQLVFLVGHNAFTYLQENSDEMSNDVRAAIRHVAPDWPAKKDHVWNVMEGSTLVTHRWSQSTLQLQQWSLFAPTIGLECFFPALLLTDMAPPDTPLELESAPARYRVHGKIILSDNEPPDMRHYFRFGNFRLRKFENNLFPYLVPKQDEAPQKTEERFRDRIKEYMSGTENQEMLRGYIRHRLKQTGESTPRQVILVMRQYSLKDPDSPTFVEGPFTLPFARWLPDNGNTLEYFDPVTHRFEPCHP